MKKLEWLDEEQVEISGVGLVEKGSIFEIDDKRAASFVNQNKAEEYNDTVSTSSVKTKTVKKEK